MGTPSFCWSVALATTIMACGTAVGRTTTTATVIAYRGASIAGARSIGKDLYAQNCVACHGDRGQGSADAPPLVGMDALPLEPPPNAKLRTMEFQTVEDVYAFLKVHMPNGKDGPFTDEDYSALLAFNLTGWSETIAPRKARAETPQSRQ